MFGSADVTVLHQTIQDQHDIQLVEVGDQDDITEESSQTMQQQQLVENIKSLRNRAVHNFAPVAEIIINETAQCAPNPAQCAPNPASVNMSTLTGIADPNIS